MVAFSIGVEATVPSERNNDGNDEEVKFFEICLARDQKERGEGLLAA
jgi:hypothetical protein